MREFFNSRRIPSWTDCFSNEICLLRADSNMDRGIERIKTAINQRNSFANSFAKKAKIFLITGIITSPIKTNLN